MPNTLIHIAIQAPLSRGVFRNIEIPWILAGTIIPDIPWIFQRIAIKGNIFDPYQLRLYFTVQASLAFCLLLCSALASFSKRPLLLFSLLASNAFMHLLLDSLQIKWGNGVHLLAPFSWHPFSYGFVWPEHITGYLLSALGILYLAYYFKTIEKEGLETNRTVSCKAALIPLALYLFLPLLFMGQLERSNSNYVETLINKEERAGKKIELDRAYFSAGDATVTLFSGESISLTGTLPAQSGTISLQGEFTRPNLLKTMKIHSHNNYRNYASYIGLMLSFGIWTYLGFINHKKKPIRRKRK